MVKPKGIRLGETQVLYRSDRFFSAFPSVVTLPSGDVLMAFRRAPDHRWLIGAHGDADMGSVDHVHPRSHIALRRFGPDLVPKGDAWAMPMHPEAGDQDGNLFVTRAGRLIQYSFLWYPVTGAVAARLGQVWTFNVQTVEGIARYLPFGTYVRLSDDEGANWTGYQRLPRGPEPCPAAAPPESQAGAVRGRMVELPGGRLLLARYQAGIGYPFQATRFLTSEDSGQTWQVEPVTIKVDGEVHLQEPALALWPEGAITVFHRTAGLGDRLVTACSHDGGQSFSPPEIVPIQGHPYDPLVLPDGRLLLAYGYRHAPMGVRARIVEPGQLIETAAEIVIRDDSPSRDTGYPSATLLPDGRILIAYYSADMRGLRGIEGTILELD